MRKINYGAGRGFCFSAAPIDLNPRPGETQEIMAMQRQMGIPLSGTTVQRQSRTGNAPTAIHISLVDRNRYGALPFRHLDAHIVVMPYG